MSGRSLNQEFVILTRDIDWQRASFLSNNLAIVWPPDQNQPIDAPAEIMVRKILDHYFLLALLFYRQLRNDLLEQFSHGRLTDKREVKILMQVGMDKLVKEWYRVYAAILSIRAGQSNEEARRIMGHMQPVLEAARADVHPDPDFLAVLHFGQGYSMRFFNYLEGVAALNMPLASFESPWEWTILWHELAGEKVRSLKNADSYFFDYILADILQSVEAAQAQETGWSADWVEELFEDSFSVASFPVHFLYVLKNLLERYADTAGSEESRHPPQAVRLAVAMSFHLQRQGFTAPPDLRGWGEAIWRNTWPELRDPSEQHPARFSEFDPAVLLPDPLQFKLAWLAAERILLWHNQQDRTHARHASVHKVVDNAIIEYSRGSERVRILQDTLEGLAPALGVGGGILGHRVPNQPLERIEQVVQDKSIQANNQILDELEAQNQKVWRLLRNGSEDAAGKLGYQDLLAIPFDDVDYGVETVTNVTYKGNTQFGNGAATLKSIIKLAPQGLVSFTLSNNKTKLTNISNWNKAAAPGFSIQQ